MAQQPEIDLTIMAAEGLKNVSLMRTKMAPYAVAFVDPYSKHSTRVLAKGGKDPIWNDSMRIAVPAGILSDPSAALTIQVFSQGTIATSIVGSTQLLLQDLFRNAALKGNGEGDILTLQLFRPSGRAHGIVRVFLKLSGEGLPGLPGLLGDGFDGPSCYESAPVTGIPVMPTMGIQSAALQRHPGYSSEKFAYPYPAPMYGHSAVMPYSTARSPCPKRNNNFLYGLVSGAVAAILLGSIF